jgi:hypothetical protein
MSRTDYTTTGGRTVIEGGTTASGSTAGWYATEVPSILSGLEASASISAATATVAWGLVEQGDSAGALALALREAMDASRTE